MGKITDKAKDLLNKNEEKVEQGLDKAADVIDEKTGHKHTDKIDSAVDKIKGVIGDKEA
ncbi:MAG: antitoxin [Actinobacteria bacterium]|nr:antitoxin [Actinomycetota bacterium]